MTEQPVNVDEAFAVAVKLKDAWLKTQEPSSFEACIAVLDGLLERDPDQLPVLQMKGLLHFTAQQAARAIPCYQRITAARPDSEDASSYLFEMHVMNGDFASAVQEMERYLSHYPLGSHYRNVVQDFRDQFEQWRDAAADAPHVLQALDEAS